MIEKAKISVIQLFSMMFIFDLGTALVVGYGISARKDAWLAILLGMGEGIILFYIYYFLYRQYPNLPFTRVTREIFGKYLGWVIGMLYILYFLYIAARNVRDFGELIISSTLRETPLLVVVVLFVLVICYVLYLGIEVLGRTAEVFIVILFLFGLAGNFLLIVSGAVDFQHLRPFLENGWKPILWTSFWETFLFPFGEMLVFLMLLPYLNESKKMKKVWLSAVVSSGMILSWTAALNIAVLSVDVTERATFPTLSSVGKINLFDFIQRLDALVVFTLLITVFFKASVFLYGTVIGIVDLFKLKNHQQILFPVGGILIFFSLTMASSFTDHIEEGYKVFSKIHPFLVIIIPFIMMVVYMIESRFKKKARES